jgi:hypothetical protein
MSEKYFSVSGQHLRIHQFFRSEDESAFHSLLHLKYEIFVQELGFTTLKHDTHSKRVFPDRYDDQGHFTTVINSHETMIGMIRSLIIQGDFPHKSLFEHHSSIFPFDSTSGYLSTINALGVVASMRKKLIDCQYCGKKITIGQILLVQALEWLRQKGVLVVLASTNPPLTRKLLLPIGFQVIDPIAEYELSPQPVVNLALLLNDTDYLQSELNFMSHNPEPQILSPLEQKLKAYIDSRHVRYEKDISTF